MLALFQQLLKSWAGTDDGATQSDLELDNDSASDKSIKSDKGSELSFEEDTRSSTAGPIGFRRPAVERTDWVIEAETPALASDPAPKALDSEFVTLEFGSSKKDKKKKSKVSAKRAVFEED